MPPIKARQQAKAYEDRNKNVPPHQAFIEGFLYAMDYFDINEDDVIFTPSCHCASPKPSDPLVGEEKTLFEEVWKLYDRKDNKQNALRSWNKLTKTEKQRAIAHIPLFVKAHPDKRYRPMLATYLNQKRFNDEEIIDNGTKTTTQQDRLTAYANAISNVGAKG